MARVLIVEDHEINLELMRYLLSSFGHDVVTATDGSAGLLAADRASYDLIVCDVHMPGMDGLEFLTTLRARGFASLPPVVAVTASAMVGDREKLLHAGFDGYVSKPIDPKTFVQQLEAFLTTRQPVE